MASRVTTKEYIVIGGIIVLFLISAGKYYKDVSVNTAIIEDKFSSWTLEHTTPLEGIETESFTLTFNDGAWQVQGTDRISVQADSETLVLVGAEDTDLHTASFEGLSSFTGTTGQIVTDIPSNTLPGATISLSEQEDFVPIFGYHDVLADDDIITSPTIQIHESDFREQVRFATEDMGCHWYTFGHIMENFVLQNKKTPENACVMTFDDGFESTYTRVLPVLKEYDAVATFFVIVSKLDAPERYLSWTQLDELYTHGNEIGSHGYDAGGFISEDWNAEELKRQLVFSKQVLENRGYKNIQTFAYPLGEWNDRIVELTEEAGYIAARDTLKDNHWRDRRSLSATYDSQARWHMHYFRPELSSHEELVQRLGYNGFWQFEEGYRIALDENESVVPLSSTKPEELSYGVVRLQDPGDTVGSRFIASQSGTYTFNIVLGTPLGVTSESIGAYVDGTRLSLTRNTNEACVLERVWNFCTYTATTELKEGMHELAIATFDRPILADKFTLAHEHVLQDEYTVTLSYR